MRDDDTDGLIDRALATYSNAEPLNGLEARVLNRVRGSRSLRTSGSWAGLVVAVSTALLLLVANVVFRTVPLRHAHALRAHEKTRLISNETEISAHISEAQPRPRARGRRRARANAAVKREQFPAPARPSNEEKALLTLVRVNPEVAAILAQQSGDESRDIVIEPITITPLADDDAQ